MGFLNFAKALQFQAAFFLGDDNYKKKSYREILALDPDHVDSLNNLAGILAEEGQLNEAYELSPRALSLSPNYTEVIGTHGHISALTGRFDEALRDANRLLHDRAKLNNPLCGWPAARACAFEIKGMCCEDRGDFDTALRHYKKSRELDPKNTDITRRIEQVYEKLRANTREPIDSTSRLDELYSVLEVRPGASAEVIASARKALILKYHPDRNPDRLEWAHEMTRRVIEAYEILSDPERKKEYERGQR